MGDVVAGDMIGVEADGRTPAPNQFTAVEVVAAKGPVGNEVIGGGSPAATNLLSGNKSCMNGDCKGFGIDVESGAGTLIERNLIGTTASGQAKLANTTGVVLLSAGNRLGGGTLAAGNIISGSFGDAVLLGASGTVTGNLIGTNATGKAALRNRGHGIDAQSAVVVIRNNVISANGDTGVVLFGGDTVQGNTVGTDATGTVAFGNRIDGIGSRSDNLKGSGFCQQALNTDGSDNLIGGTAAGDGNLISRNAGDGVDLVASNRNVIAGNRVGTNGAGTGALCSSSPPGPNDYTGCPVIATATTTKVTGHACANCLVEVYLAEAGPGDQGHEEGAALLATTTAAADGTSTAASAPDSSALRHW